MKKNLQKLLAAAGLLLAIGFSQKAEASHAQGADLTYTCVAPNMYMVTYKLYRDCTGITPSTTCSLSLKSTGCNNGRTVSLPQVGSPVTGNLYCPQITPGCSATSPYPNYQEYTYSGTVTFSAAETACPDWTFSASECSRQLSANLANASSYCLYTEAYVRLGAGINNSSPQFGSFTVPYVNKGMPITLSSFATDPDEDSLVYSLKPALDSPNTPIAYSALNASAIIYNPSDSTKYTLVGPGSFSSTFPIYSYNVNWLSPAPYTKTPNFFLDPNSGSMSFTPSIYNANTQPVLGANKYVVVVQVDEWRKINNAPVKVGSVRREMLITVIDCGPNVNPRVTNPVANSQSITPATIINLRPGATLNFSVNSDDANAGNILEMSSDAAQMLPGASFTVASANHPTGILSWTPTAAQVKNQVYYFHVTVKDNACPIKGFSTQTYAVRVSNSGSVTGTKNDLNNQLAFIAYPNPFTEKVSFKVNLTSTTNQEIQIYNTLGKLVDKISLKNLPAGAQEVVWEKGSKLANGNYLAKLVKENQITQTIQFSKMQ